MFLAFEHLVGISMSALAVCWTVKGCCLVPGRARLPLWLRRCWGMMA